MSYIVKNCPAYNDMPNMYDEIYGYCDNEHNIDLDKCMCENITDCVIKRLIEKCKDSKLSYSKLEILRTACETNQAYGKAVMAEQVLQLFDIEEINKWQKKYL